MNEGLSFLATHLRIGIAEHESNRGEEIALSRPIASDDDIELG